MNGMGRGKDKLVLSNVEGAGTSSARHDQVTSVKVQGSTTDHMDLGENIVNIDGGNLSNVAVIQGSDVASDEGRPWKHTALRIGEEASVKMTKPKSGHVLPVSVCGNVPKPSTKAKMILKNDMRHSLKVKRKDDRGQGRITLASRVAELTSELDHARQFGKTCDSNLQHVSDSVEWRENMTFDRPNGDRTQV
ncbi:hypothetical protein V6N13_021092 [Hibiscus sabdariffa]|uniref:Uncharacterized protein n=2 Tax=Hibiscus sabdariffa TaxID=183260 RepID=A0ABR2EVX4_9ROSI